MPKKSPSGTSISRSAERQLHLHFGSRLQQSVPLASLTTIKIGGPAEFLFRAQTAAELVEAVEAAQQAAIPFWLLGGGSNLVISDNGLPGLVIVDENRQRLEIQDCLLTVSSGYALSEVVQACRLHEQSGFEFAVGIPGGIGGAVCGNAGAYGCTVGEILVEAEVWIPGEGVRTVPAEFFQFEYRDSVLKRSDGIVLSAVFRIQPGERSKIEAVMQQNLKRRLERLPPPDLPSAGSFFKNLPPEHPGEWRRPAGQFLEQAGVKGMRVGGAQVYEKHANIIVNTGSATAKDVRDLALKMRARVQEKFGIELVEEARFLGAID